MKRLKAYFLNDWWILFLIIVNTLFIFWEEFGVEGAWIDWVEAFFTFAFIFEMYVKIQHYSFKGYLKNGWNQFDFILVILSLPSLLALFNFDVSLTFNLFLVFRIFRVFKVFRLFKFLPNADNFVSSVKRAIKASYIILFGFFILIFVVALVSTTFYRTIAPEYFNNPMQSLYTIFRLFSIEGWYEIPDLIAERTNATIGFWTKFYFSVLLLVGGILGLSLVNSIFVDAMVSDNTDDLEQEVAELKSSIHDLHQKIDILVAEKEELKNKSQ